MTISAEQLNKIFSDAFNQPVVITKSMTRADLPAWDSMNHLNLIVELEEQLGVSFSPEEIQKMNSVAILEQILSSK